MRTIEIKIGERFENFRLTCRSSISNFDFMSSNTVKQSWKLEKVFFFLNWWKNMCNRFIDRWHAQRTDGFRYHELLAIQSSKGKCLLFRFPCGWGCLKDHKPVYLSLHVVLPSLTYIMYIAVINCWPIKIFCIPFASTRKLAYFISKIPLFIYI